MTATIETKVHSASGTALKPGVVMRQARTSDALAIAELHRLASEGAADVIWERQAERGETPGDVGASLVTQDSGEMSWQNATVVRQFGMTVSVLHAAPAGEPAPLPSEEDPALRPFRELSEPGSLFIRALCVYPAFRGHGMRAALLKTARLRARAGGLDRLSILAFEQDAATMAFLESEGFQAIDRRALQAHEVIRARGDVVLMVAPA